MDPKPILNDQVGFVAGPNEKISGTSRSTVSTEQKNSRKTDFQIGKIRNFFCHFSYFGKTFFKLEIWILMMISMAKNSI